MNLLFDRVYEWFYRGLLADTDNITYIIPIQIQKRLPIIYYISVPSEREEATKTD